MDDEALTRHVARVLRHDWDPIELGAEGPADEYDGYVAGAVALVRNSACSEADIAEHLMKAEAEAMRMVPAPPRAVRTARALLGLREACDRALNRLVTQAMSPDGLHCLQVFQRPDGFFTFEHARLQHGEDENGAWSCWTGAGDGPSGLFATAEAAEAEARSTIEWLQWRRMSLQETAVLDRLLSASFPGRNELAAQARTALVRRIDRDGSLSFWVSGPRADVRQRVPAEGRYLDGGAEPGWRPAVNLLLHVVDGQLHELEVYKDDGSGILTGPFEIAPDRINLCSP